MSEVYAIIVAAGAGSRFGGDMPKQFLDLDGMPVCVRSVRCFADANPRAHIILVLPEHDFGKWKAFVGPYLSDIPAVTFVAGGSNRWESVKNALDAIPRDAPGASTVLVHDGARPLVERAVIDRVTRATLNTDGAIPAVPVVDSLRRVESGRYGSEPVDRSEYRAVQTPQGSKLWRFRQAYEHPYEEVFTDDSSVLTAAGFSNIVLVEGSYRNIKITTPEDLKIARCLI